MSLAKTLLLYMIDSGKPWVSATQTFTVEDGMISYTGTFTDTSLKVADLGHVDLRPGLCSEVMAWRLEMETSKTGKWNKFNLTVYPDQRCEIHFSWDQAVQDETDRISAESRAERAAEAEKQAKVQGGGDAAEP